MYSKVLFFNKKIIFVVFFILFIGTMKPAHSATGVWTSFSTDYGTTIPVYSSQTPEQVKIDLTVQTTGVATFIYLDNGLDTQQIDNGGGSFTIVTRSASIEIIGGASGQYRVTEIQSGGDAMAQQMGAIEFISAFYLLPIIVAVITMAVTLVNWRKNP